MLCIVLLLQALGELILYDISSCFILSYTALCVAEQNDLKSY